MRKNKSKFYYWHILGNMISLSFSPSKKDKFIKESTSKAVDSFFSEKIERKNI